MSQHAHTVNHAVSGLSALPGTAQSYAATRAMSRFAHNEGVSFAAVIEPAQDRVRAALAASPTTVALVLHDWCMFNFHTHTAKADRWQRSHATDLGYELGSALVVETAEGRPLGPMEFRLRTAQGMLSTRARPTTCPAGHIDELLEVMDESRRWSLGQQLVHVIDREADSVGHYRLWHARGHHFVVRADQQRLVMAHGQEQKLAAVVTRMAGHFQEVKDAAGQPEVVTIRAGAGVVKVAEAQVILHRPAKTREADRQVEVPGPPIALRLVVTRVVNALGVVLAEWWLLTNVTPDRADAATIGRWYAWRWRIESYHKLLKSAGMNAEAWQQETGEAFLRRLCVASMACLTVWQLQSDPSEAAASLRRLLVRLSGRQMKHRVESTAPALLAGLEKLLAWDDVLVEYDVAEILALARQVLPTLFARRKRSPPVTKL